MYGRGVLVNMSVEQLMDSLKKLVSLHQSLYDLETLKTNVIKKGDIEALSSILKDENRHVMAINKIEDERKLIVAKLLSGYPILGEEPSLTDVINIVKPDESEKLQDLRGRLTQLLKELKILNQLNQQLVQSSLQFVNLSLDLLMPQPQSLNYNKPTNKSQAVPEKRSMFDSKA